MLLMHCLNYRLLPDSFNRVGIHLSVLANEGKRMVHCLGDENAIEWIAVMKGQGEVYF
jgi:hypothetical protein